MGVADSGLIGDASIPLDPWLPSGREAEHALFEEAGAPVEWWPYLLALRWTFPPTSPLPDSPINLRVGGGGAPRTLAELHHAAELGLGINLAVGDGFDLNSLEGVLHRIRFLALGSTGTIRNLSLLARAESLVQLTVSARAETPIASAGLPRLERADIPGALVELASGSKVLTELELDFQSDDGLPTLADTTIEGPIHTLHTVGANSLPRFARPEELRILRVLSAREPDLRSMSDRVDVEWLELVEVDRLLGFDRLAEMKRLKQVTFERVGSAPDASTPIEVAVAEINRSDPRLSELTRRRR